MNSQAHRADLRVIDLMTQIGGDPSSPTEVNHYLYFPTEQAAELAAEVPGCTRFRCPCR